MKWCTCLEIACVRGLNTLLTHKRETNDQTMLSNNEFKKSTKVCLIISAKAGPLCVIKHLVCASAALIQENCLHWG